MKDADLLIDGQLRRVLMGRIGVSPTTIFGTEKIRPVIHKYEYLTLISLAVSTAPFIINPQNGKISQVVRQLRMELVVVAFGVRLCIARS